MDFKKLAAARVAEYISCNKESVERLIEAPKDSRHGDYSLPCFTLCKTMGCQPNDMAEELKKNISAQGFQKVVNCGPYLNFYIDKSLFISNTIYNILSNEDNFLEWNRTTIKNAVLLCSPNLSLNPGKLQEVQASILLNTMHNLLTLKGGLCIRENELDVIINEQKRNKIIKGLGRMGKVIDCMDSKAVFFPDSLIPPFIFSRGGKNARIIDSLIRVAYSSVNCSLTRIVYIMDRESSYYYRQLKGLLSLLNNDCSEKLSVISFGRIKFNEMALYSRINEASFLKELISIISSKLHLEIHEVGIKFRNESEAVEKLALGALTTLCLNSIRSGVETCSINSVASLAGECFPFVQYVHAKVNKILASSAEVPIGFIPAKNSLLNSHEAYKLAVILSKYKTVLEEAANELRLDLIASYCISLAYACESFNNSFDIHLSSSCELGKASLCLLKSVITVIEHALIIVGVEVVEIM